MTIVEQMASFVKRASWGEISQEARDALKLRVLDSLACALGAMEGEQTTKTRPAVQELNDACHKYDVLVSTGGFIEHVLAQGPETVDLYLKECKELGFDIVEVSSGFITIPVDDMVRLTEKVQKMGLKAKPEINIQFGAGGASSVEELESEGLLDPGKAIKEAKRHLEAGAYKIMVESEGITEQVRTWRTDISARIADELGSENIIFEGSDPPVFAWYIKNFGPEVNPFVDHSQIVELECMRSGIWGTADLWGKVLTYKSLQLGRHDGTRMNTDFADGKSYVRARRRPIHRWPGARMNPGSPGDR